MEKHYPPPTDEWDGCKNVPEFDRLHYYYGQMLGPRDFQTEQDFFRNKQKLLNRCLHGWGVVCGLEVTDITLAESAKAKQKYPAEKYEKVIKDFPPLILDITPGMALDPAGNELVVRQRGPWERPWLPWERSCQEETEESLPKFCLDISQILKKQGVTETLDSIEKIYVSLYYYECEHGRQRVPNTCENWCANYETYAKLRDLVCVDVSLAPPPADDRCGPCCEPFGDSRVLLARIDNPFDPETQEIHNEVRRPLSLYVPTTITGINWDHGAVYYKGEVDKYIRLKDGGLRVRFSRPVLAGTIKAGVIEVWRSSDYPKQDSAGDLERLPVAIQEFNDETTEEVSFAVHEDLGRDDGVLIIVRTDFILDKCCRPVDGNHVGGLVPRVSDSKFPQPVPSDQLAKVAKEDRLPYLDGVPEPKDRCRPAHGLYGPWQSGNGTPGGTFESWFFTVRDQQAE